MKLLHLLSAFLSSFHALGQQFLVQYNLIGTGMAPSVPGYLCLLCEKKCVVDVCSHVFSYNHVTAFLVSIQMVIT